MPATKGVRAVSTPSKQTVSLVPPDTFSTWVNVTLCVHKNFLATRLLLYVNTVIWLAQLVQVDFEKKYPNLNQNKYAFVFIYNFYVLSIYIYFIVGPLSTDCTSCMDGYFFFRKNCLLICPSGYWKDEASKSCPPCHSSCFACTGPAEN